LMWFCLIFVIFVVLDCCCPEDGQGMPSQHSHYIHGQLALTCV
jgi:hypothetical protein